MLSEVKLAMRLTSTAYDAEIASLIQAAALDLSIAGVLVNGISFGNNNGNIVDNSTCTDPLILRAIITYVRMHFGSPDDYDKLVAAYDIQKAQLQIAGGYNDRIDDDRNDDNQNGGW